MMDMKKNRQFFTIFWAMLFCFHTIFCLLRMPDTSIISWIWSGFLLGGTIMTLLNNKIMNMQDELIKDLLRLRRKKK